MEFRIMFWGFVALLFIIIFVLIYAIIDCIVLDLQYRKFEKRYEEVVLKKESKIDEEEEQ